jgi:hypothetical protein
VPATKVISS